MQLVRDSVQSQDQDVGSPETRPCAVPSDHNGSIDFDSSSACKLKYLPWLRVCWCPTVGSNVEVNDMSVEMTLVKACLFVRRSAISEDGKLYVSCGQGPILIFSVSLSRALPSSSLSFFVFFVFFFFFYVNE